MVLYDFLMIVKSSVPKSQLGDILRRTGARVLDAGGVITDITSYGTQTLAYEFKSPGEKHFEVRPPRRSPGPCGISARRGAAANLTTPNAARSPSPGFRALPPQAHMMQMSFNVKPTLIEELKHDMRTDERVLRWIAVKDRALRPLKEFPARDPRNPLNIAAMNKDQ